MLVTLFKVRTRYWIYWQPFVIALLFVPYPLKAESIKTFSRSASVTDASMSPNGRYLAYTRINRQRQYLVITNLRKPLVVQFSAELSDKLEYWWLNGDDLMFSRSQFDKLSKTPKVINLYRVNAAAQLNLAPGVSTDRLKFHSKRYEIGPKMRVDRILSSRNYREISNLGSSVTGNYLLFQLKGSPYTQLQFYDFKSKILQVPAGVPEKITRWLIDSKGTLKLAVQRNENGMDDLLAPDGNAGWKLLTSVEPGSLIPLAYDNSKQRVIVASIANRDYFAIFWLNPFTGVLTGPVYEDPGYDVTTVTTSAIDGRLLYIQYEAKRLQKVLFDRASNILLSRIDSVLPETVNDIVSSSDDGHYYLIRAFSDKQPDKYYLLNDRKSTIKLLINSRHWVKPIKMSNSQVITIAQSGGEDFQGILTPNLSNPPSGQLLMQLPSSQTESKFTWGFSAFAQFIANQGASLLQLNHLGTPSLRESTIESDENFERRLVENIGSALTWAQNQRAFGERSPCLIVKGEAAEWINSIGQNSNFQIQCLILIEPIIGVTLLKQFMDSANQLTDVLMVSSSDTLLQSAVSNDGNTKLKNHHVEDVSGLMRDEATTVTYQAIAKFLLSLSQ